MQAEHVAAPALPPTGQGSDAIGFTLLEVLVALAIFAIAFGVIAGIFQTSLRQSETAESLLEATALAETQIARFGNDLPLAIGRLSGRSPEGLRWSAAVDLAAPALESSDLALYEITLDVASKDGAQHYLTLKTLRISRPP